MRNSGCEVPEYMLQMKKTSKSEAKKMARVLPERKSISTEPFSDKIKRKKLEGKIAESKHQVQKNGFQPKAKRPSSISKEPIPEKNKRKKLGRKVAVSKKSKPQQAQKDGSQPKAKRPKVVANSG